MVRLEASSQPMTSGTSDALESAIFIVALDSDEIMDTADVIAVVRAAIFKSIDSAVCLPEVFFPVPGVTPGLLSCQSLAFSAGVNFLYSALE